MGAAIASAACNLIALQVRANFRPRLFRYAVCGPGRTPNFFKQYAPDKIFASKSPTNTDIFSIGAAFIIDNQICTMANARSAYTDKECKGASEFQWVSSVSRSKRHHSPAGETPVRFRLEHRCHSNAQTQKYIWLGGEPTRAIAGILTGDASCDQMLTTERVSGPCFQSPDAGFELCA